MKKSGSDRVFAVRGLTFTYPGRNRAAIKDINLDVRDGEFICLLGKSGCGKTTLLRNLKPSLAPHGALSGSISFKGRPLSDITDREDAASIGYVLQNPDNQIVTDKVWHELAFGLENLGMDSRTIRIRTAEMASFFGIQTWFNEKVSELSGGQKQLLNLAAVMVMQPDVLILDEPTSQLDPIAAADFLDTVKKVNREIGTTVIITEHRLEEVLPMSDRAVVMDGGRIIIDDSPANAGAILAVEANDMFVAMPAPLQAYSAVYNRGIGRNLECPLDVQQGRKWLDALLTGREPAITEIKSPAPQRPAGQPRVEFDEVWFRYDRNSHDVIKGLSFKVWPGEIYAIMGGNGTGKTTALTLMSGINRAWRGKIRIDGRSIDKYTDRELFTGKLGVLPQNPQAIFVEKSVGLDLYEMLSGRGLAADVKKEKVEKIAELMELGDLMSSHPYDLSGGEQQRVAMAKILLMEPEILMLDEPTKGIDNHFKEKLADILKQLKSRGVTIVMVSHDVEFCGKHADRCAMFFDGAITTENTPREFFSGNSFYTTAANRMSRGWFRNAITASDVSGLVLANFTESAPQDKGRAGGGTEDIKKAGPEKGGSASGTDMNMDMSIDMNSADPVDTAGSGSYAGAHKPETERPDTETARPGTEAERPKPETARRRPMPALLWCGALILMLAALVFGYYRLGDRNYYLISAALIILAMIPFFLSFERKRPRARELITLAVLTAIGVAGRAAFFMLPQVKPVIAVSVLAGATLGPGSGFIVGTMIAFVSNFMFGQGAWTPWQMFALGMTGLIAGLLFCRHDHRGVYKKPASVPVTIYGFFAAYLYGAIVDIWTIFVVGDISWKTVLTVYGGGLIFSTVFGASTAAFLLVMTKPMSEKIERIRNKYGLMQG